MAATRFLGLIFVLATVFGRVRSEAAISEGGQEQMSASNENTFSIQIPFGNGNIMQTDTQVQPAQRRLSLEEFFFGGNNNNNNAEQKSEPAVQQPIAQFQVQQPDPNSMLLVRDTQFPSSSGGLISRLLMLRRMLRIRRLARRLTIIPRLLGLGVRSLQRSALASNQNPLVLFSNRAGEMYNPRDFVFGNKGFSYNNTNANVQQRNANGDQLQRQSRGYSAETDPYYNSLNDGFNNQYDLENSNVKSADNFESQELNALNNQDVLNSLTNEQQLFLLQQLQTYQQQLNQLQEQLNKEPKNINQQTQGQVNDILPIQYQQPQQNIEHIQTNQYYQSQQNAQHQQNHRGLPQPELLTDQQLEQVRQLQSELLKEQLLQLQQEQQQLQQLQLSQQAQNLKQQQNFASVEQGQTYQIHNNQQLLTHPQNAHSEEAKPAGDRTEGYGSPVGIGGSIGYGNAGNTVGVGINVGIKPPAVDFQVTKPEIKPFPSLVNPIVPKPLPSPPKVEPLVPLGILPKPMLNLKGRVFFGAQMGKGVGVKAGAGR